MLSVSQAETIILERVHPFDPTHDSEWVSLMDGRDRVLAQPVTSPLDFPHWDNSAMDGYAVRYADVSQATPEFPVMLTVVETIPAGTAPHHTVTAGEAARIFTGSVMPPGADTVVMQENTQRQGDRVLIFAAPATPCAFVRKRGSFYHAGSVLLEAGIQLQAAEIAVLAAAQCAQVAVFRRPRVAILSTGDELVGIDQPLGPGQIVDSNQYALAAALAATGAVPLRLGIVPDQPDVLQRQIEQAIATADVVLSSGGVSVGEYDYVDEILVALGAKIPIRAVAIKPGKPLTVAHWPTHSGAVQASTALLYFGLPGNPVSALVTFWRFVQPALRKLMGLKESQWRSPVVIATTATALRADDRRETYVWGQLHLNQGKYRFIPAGGNPSSGNLINLAGSNGLAILLPSQGVIDAGQSVPVMQILPLFCGTGMPLYECSLDDNENNSGI